MLPLLHGLLRFENCLKRRRRLLAGNLDHLPSKCLPMQAKLLLDDKGLAVLESASREVLTATYLFKLADIKDMPDQ